MAESNWYVVHTYSGYENKVKVDIEKTIENRNLHDQILEVTVPMEDVVEVKNGVKKQVQKKLFPGYVLINMVMNFGIVYGISAFGLSEDLSISRQEALEYINQYFETYPGVKAFLDQTVAQARKTGYVTTLYGRRRPVPELSSSNFMQRSFGERAAMNSPIQGTAADIIKIAMVEVDRRLRREGLKSRLILQIHDELLVETDQAEIEQVETILKEEMDGAAKLSVPLEVDMKVGNSWFETK